ncbi:hypothetical protein K3495_g5663 [Podosphaera aphanis]|nr:hypothetical protein K3495_g5663 [Podosphaera aphanis]
MASNNESESNITMRGKSRNSREEELGGYGSGGSEHAEALRAHDESEGDEFRINMREMKKYSSSKMVKEAMRLEVEKQVRRQTLNRREILGTEDPETSRHFAQFEEPLSPARNRESIYPTTEIEQSVIFHKSERLPAPEKVSDGEDPDPDSWALSINHRLAYNGDRYTTQYARMMFVYEATEGFARTILKPRMHSKDN